MGRNESVFKHNNMLFCIQLTLDLPAHDMTNVWK